MRIQRQFVRSVEKTQRTQVVNAKKMIGVRVGVKNSVKLANLFAYCLLAKIRRGINEHTAPTVLDEDRRPGATVTRVSRMTNGAIAPDGRHAHRRAAAEHGEQCFHLAAGTCCGPLAIALVTST